MEMQSTLTDKVRAEVEAMCHYATANGLKVPPRLTSETLRLVDQAEGEIVGEDAEKLSNFTTVSAILFLLLSLKH